MANEQATIVVAARPSFPAPSCRRRRRRKQRVARSLVPFVIAVCVYVFHLCERQRTAEAFALSSLSPPRGGSSGMVRSRPPPPTAFGAFGRPPTTGGVFGRTSLVGGRLVTGIPVPPPALFASSPHRPADDDLLAFDEGEDFDPAVAFEEAAAMAAEQQHPMLQPPRQFRRPKKVPLLAIVGRPNVGKSALVNRIAGTQSGGAIVADESGITRDRTYRNAQFLGEHFQVVDTGGIVYDDNDALFAREIREQAMVAIEESAGVVLVVDGQSGFTAMDQQIADFLRKEVSKHVPVLVAVNKCESEKNAPIAAAEFWGLGLGEPLPVSAIHGVGTADLLELMFDRIAEKGSAIDGFGTKVKELKAARAAVASDEPMDEEDEADAFLRQYGLTTETDRVLERYERALAAFDEDEQPEEINIAIVGRPNVGKSSLLNSVFGSRRAIVSEVAGTTRDSIDAIMERPPPPGAVNATSTLYRFVDTAGIRRKGKVEFGPEFFMVNRALRAIRRADVALLVLDATAGVAEQDRILAQKISDDGRACVIVMNKWDAVVDKDSTTYNKSVRYLREELPQVRWAPILFVSAETGQRVGKIFGAVDEAVKAHRKRISTAILNEVLRDAILWQPPPARRNGAQAKIYYCNQVSTRPPTVVVFCNDPSLVSDNYKRYLDRKFRESIEGFEASPVRWIFRGRRVRDVMRARKMNGDPGDGGMGTSFPFPHAG